MEVIAILEVSSHRNFSQHNFIFFPFQYRDFDLPAGILGASSAPLLPKSQPPVVAQSTSAKVEIVQSATKPLATARAKTPEATGRKSITSLGSIGSNSAELSIAVPRSPSPTSPKSAAVKTPLPEIQITRTESNRSTVDEKWVKPEKMEDEKGN